MNRQTPKVLERKRRAKPYWDRIWLDEQYTVQNRSAFEIAMQFGCTENTILYFLNKHGIPRRTISEARRVKYWGIFGPANGMYGATGEANPNWKGGITPERQALYSSREWGEAVKEVWARDRGICQRCGKAPAGPRKMHIHHIAVFDVVELRTESSNLMLLCTKCHGFVHSKANTEKEYLSDS